MSPAARGVVYAEAMDRVIVITGASSGIGASLAELLGARGARLVLAARREPELAAALARAGTNALKVVADVTRRADVERVAAECLTRFGRLDVWINNAGRGISRSVLELSDQDFDEMMSVNVKSALPFCTGKSPGSAAFRACKNLERAGASAVDGSA